MKVGDLVKLMRDCDYQPQIFRRGMVGIVATVATFRKAYVPLLAKDQKHHQQPMR